MQVSKKIVLAKTAGFCFGVDRAVNLVYELVEKGEKVCTLGPIIHNAQLVNDLENRGVRIVENPNDVPKDYTLVVRTHGVEKEIIDTLTEKKIKFVDATCPFVKKIHRIVDKCDENTTVLIAGDKNHPEVLGIRSYCKGKSFVFKTADELQAFIDNQQIDMQNDMICVAQTTFSLLELKKCKKILQKVCTNCKFFDTICSATAERQNEAEKISKTADAMVVIGGRHSSNTCKLKDVSSNNCPSFLIETAEELSELSLEEYDVIGVTAGASTPATIIKEVLKTMSEEIKEKEVETTSAITEEVVETAETAPKAAKPAVEASADGEATFEELLNASFKENENSKVVTGIVARITNTEVFVDVPGRKQTGVVAFDDLSSAPISSCEEVVSVGDEIKLVIMKTDDQDGVLKLSKRLYDSVKGYDEIVAAKEADEILEGVVSDVIRGGVLVSTMGTKVFVPASLTGVPRGTELSTIKGNTVRLKVIDLNPSRRSGTGSIKVVADAERKEKAEALWASLEEGAKMTGTVKSLKTWGAYVDLGGMDGMIHISQLSWSRIKHPSEVVNVGDVVEVTILSLEEKEDGSRRISLGYKKTEDNPWEIFKNTYNVGDVVEGTIISTPAFGAFVKILENVEGLVYISEISWSRIKTPADVLNIGDNVTVKILDIDYDRKRISLSIKALLEKPEEVIEELAEEAPVEETAESEETAE